MKNKFLLYFLTFFLIIGCATDDDHTQIENGSNPGPNLKTTGTSAADFLSSDDYEALEIELLYVQGYRPSSQAILNLRQFMQLRLNKPGGITIIEREIASPGNKPYTLDDIRQIEKDNRTNFNDVNKLALYILFVDGVYITDSSTKFTLGTSYRNTSCVIYENSVINLSNRPNGPDRTALETTVLLHELCHLLGLVDLGSRMQTNHKDAEHGNHCNNKNCLMYWQAQSKVIQAQGSTFIPQLDANCIADLQANGGK